MGNIKIPADIIVGIVEMMDVIGSTHTFRIVDIVDTDIPVQAYVFGNDMFYIEGTNVLDEELSAIISIDGLTDEEVEEIRPGNRLIELTPEVDSHTILTASIDIFAGLYAVAVVQIAG